MRTHIRQSLVSTRHSLDVFFWFSNIAFLPSYIFSFFNFYFFCRLTFGNNRIPMLDAAHIRVLCLEVRKRLQTSATVKPHVVRESIV